MDLKFSVIEEITNDFSDDQKVGSGGYGDVYKAVYNGKEIAVKKLHPLQGLDDKEFHRELLHLTKVSHQNVVQLIGYCYESRSKYLKYKGETIWAKSMERVLCFEYMQGRSLETLIADESCKLDWPTCYNIIRGTCEGLDHLHSAPGNPIFHLDLKPANILLDKSMTPKIADLGLSRIFASSKTHQTNILKGTRGYMPPEYINHRLISKKFDVFSFGVIIIKMVAGNNGYFRCSEMSPKDFLKLVSENWMKRLQAMPDLSSSHEIDILRVSTCAEIALRCVDDDRRKRPCIKDIVHELEELEAEIKDMTLISDMQIDLIGQTSSDSSILAVDPTTELRFLFEPRKDISTCLQLTNQTGGFVAFRVIVNLAKYSTKPTQGILQPCSKTYIDVTLRAQDEAPPNMVCHDKLFVQSSHVRVDSKFTSDEIIDDSLKQGMVVDMMKVLPIVYVAVQKFPRYSNHSKDQLLDNRRYIDLIGQLGSKPPLTLKYLEDITNNFCDERILGKGDFGVVYKGMLQDEKMIAVKKILQALPSSQKQFENEVNLLMKLEHQNIVRLVGYCYEERQVLTAYRGKSVLAWNIESLLCLEYMPNGSLHKYITDASCGLLWDPRYKVIEGISYGLLYLHEHCNEHIIHMDLKPANILLDANMLPKITDFGLSRLFPGNQTIVSGTLGYMPPEFLRGEITPMWDIFSLGVIILEVITGHRAYPHDIRKSFKDFIEIELQKWKNRLQKEPGYTSLEADCQQIERCIQIGLICVNPERTKRPTMKTVVNMLEGFERMHWYISNELGSNPPLPLQYLKQMTNNFSDERILGKGGFGVVYKGGIHNGEMVVVKKILQAIQSSQEQFENEVNLLMTLEHQNIVRLVGYCYEILHSHMPHEGKYVFAGNTESLLCLEYMPNGSLHEHISDASSGLNWQTRYKVIEGISYGLQYLQEHSNEPIIHLDLKPANILLDANMLPKITDFGLSRLFPGNQTIHTMNHSGTLGYMPPEFLRGIITPMWDIFSLGVIILEVITGHRAYPDDIRKSSKDFIETELEKWRNRLQKELGYTSVEADCQQIERCIQIGLICVNPERTKRPTMKKIIDMLEGIEHMDWYISNELSEP